MIKVLNYLAAAFFIAGIRFDLPICLNICLGAMIGHAIGAFAEYRMDLKRQEKEMKMYEEHIQRMKELKEKLLKDLDCQCMYQPNVPCGECCKETKNEN